MNKTAKNPIGIFDSGVGGLTVVHELTKLLPHENIIYFGDTAHVPYGDKSSAAIQAYSVKICEMLLQQNCKLILIACNSASAAAYDLVTEYVADKAKVINVIDPVVKHIKANFSNSNIGLIGTKKTVNSNIYKKKIDALELNIKLASLATPLLVPAIEEGCMDDEIAKAIVKKYLANPELTDLDALILGCTHYPIIKPLINKFYNNKLPLIDSSELAAKAVKNYLTESQLLNTQKKHNMKFYISDYTKEFVAATKLFFQHELNLEHYPLWD